MEVDSLAIVSTPFSIFPTGFAQGIVELAVNKGVIFIRWVCSGGQEYGKFRESTHSEGSSRTPCFVSENRFWFLLFLDS
jgi:hypothetical protein